MEKEKKGKGLSGSFVLGAVALVFLIVGYQTALFVNKAAVSKVLAEKNLAQADRECASGNRITISEPPKGFVTPYHKKDRAGQEKARMQKRPETQDKPKKVVENFTFDPNTVSVSDLQRLGFSEKQALSIDNYRRKGGRFRRKSDFAKSFVVADSVYQRLEAYIDIPLLDLNTADSTALDALPGIGAYFVRKIIEHRKKLGGYSYKEQLMDIYNFDEEKFAALQDLIRVSTPEPYPLWSLPEDSLKLHPYIGPYAAHGIVLFRDNNPGEQWTVQDLAAAGILKPEMADKLEKCSIAAL